MTILYHFAVPVAISLRHSLCTLQENASFSIAATRDDLKKILDEFDDNSGFDPANIILNVPYGNTADWVIAEIDFLRRSLKWSGGMAILSEDSCCCDRLKSFPFAKSTLIGLENGYLLINHTDVIASLVESLENLNSHPLRVWPYKMWNDDSFLGHFYQLTSDLEKAVCQNHFPHIEKNALEIIEMLQNGLLGVLDVKYGHSCEMIVAIRKVLPHLHNDKHNNIVQVLINTLLKMTGGRCECKNSTCGR